MQSTDPLARESAAGDVVLDQGAIVKPWFGDVVKSTVAVAGRDVQITQVNGNVLSVDSDFWPDYTDEIAEKTRWFVRRGFVFQALAKFMQDAPCGCFRIVADAGLAKSAIAAELAAPYRAPTWFFSISDGRVNPETALNGLSAQLIVRYGLPHAAVPVTAGATSDFLYQRMKEAVAKVDPSERVVIVVDALDEADPVRAGHNWLHLPKALPERVYVVLTSRPFQYQLLTTGDTSTYDLVIKRDDESQRSGHRGLPAQPGPSARDPDGTRGRRAADLRQRLCQHLGGSQRGQLHVSDVYLTYVLGDIIDRENKRTPLALEDLPTGLNKYYGLFWDQMKPTIEKPDEYTTWKSVYRPVIEFLGVAREPVTVAWLGAQTGQDPGQIRALALKRWTRFLSWRSSSGTENLADREPQGVPRLGNSGSGRGDRLASCLG